MPDESEWFEVSDDVWRDAGSRGKKLKLLADEQVPSTVVRQIRAAHIAITEFAGSGRAASDSTVLRTAEREGRVLLTLDADFWSDRKHPLHELRTGIIFVAESPDRHDRVLRAFGLLYGCFAKTYPLDGWTEMKARAVVDEFELKMRTYQSRIARYRMRLRGGRVWALELKG